MTAIVAGEGMEEEGPTLLDVFQEERLLDMHPLFGKFKGRPVRRVPVRYCRWLLDNAALGADLRKTSMGPRLITVVM